MLDSEFEAMGRSIPNATILDKYLVASIYKAVRLTNAINTLCDSGITDEALPILRSLIEHTINMCWITNKDTSARLRQYINDLGTGAFGK